MAQLQHSRLKIPEVTEPNNNTKFKQIVKVVRKKLLGLEIFREHGYIALFGTFTLTSRLMTVIMKIIKCAPARFGKDKAVARQVGVGIYISPPTADYW